MATKDDGWHWWNAIFATAMLLVVVGAAPLVYLIWDGSAHRVEPLSMPITLAPGEYTSPFFKTALNEDHQIDIYFLPADRTPLDINWKIVDAKGNILRKGEYRDLYASGNVAPLGSYRPQRGVRQKVVVNIVEGRALSDTDSSLHIGVPEEGLSRNYALPLAELWCLFLSGSGLLLLVMSVIQAKRRRLSQPLDTAAG